MGRILSSNFQLGVIKVRGMCRNSAVENFNCLHVLQKSAFEMYRFQKILRRAIYISLMPSLRREKPILKKISGDFITLASPSRTAIADIVTLYGKLTVKLSTQKCKQLSPTTVYSSSHIHTLEEVKCNLMLGVSLSHSTCAVKC